MVLDLVGRIAGTVFPLFALVLVGLVFARRTKPKLDDINRANMDIFTPALVFTILVGGEFTLLGMADLALATVLCVGLCVLLALALALLAGLDARVVMLATSFRNSGNISRQSTTTENAPQTSIFVSTLESGSQFAWARRQFEQASTARFTVKICNVNR